jgi:glycosyltransferase involved in cell wall biosynthesis
MRVLVFPVRLAIGGAQINAVDLAIGVRDRGHDVVVFSRPGPLLERVRERGLAYIPAPHPGRFRPSPPTIRELRRVVAEHGIDVVHAWGPNPSLEAFYGARIMAGVPVVASFMDMTFVDYLPGTVPLVVGTRRVEEEARRARSGPIELIEPPIDTDADHPSVDGTAFRLEHGVDANDLLIVVVSRIAFALKLESLRRAIGAVGRLAVDLPVRLAIVGDGEARPTVEREADVINRQLGRDAIVFAGPMTDPRPAYAAADVVAGMGSSILRGMSFEKPALVLGEHGFSRLVEPDTVDWFLFHGFYGRGNGETSSDLAAKQLRALLEDGASRRELGSLARGIVCERFSVRAAAERLERVYEDSVRQPPRTQETWADALSTAFRVARQKIRSAPARHAGKRRTANQKDRVCHA